MNLCPAVLPGCIPNFMRQLLDQAVAPKRTETSLETPGSCIVTP